jgi:inorganic pyrophosphatase/exopolyphosphatase
MQVFAYLKKYVSEHPSVSRHYILNNTSCDMDSFLSSIILSIARNISSNVIQFPQGQNFSLNESSNKVFLPLMNCKRGDLKSRLDIAYVMNLFKLDSSSLFYISDEEIQKELNSSDSVRLSLVDHNVLDPSQEKFADLVEEIYDHHTDTGKILYKNLKAKTVKVPCGSASTLILLDFYLSNPAVAQNCFQIIDPLFAITAILQDTNNFAESMYGDRWVDLDKFVLSEITRRHLKGFSNPEDEVNSYFKQLANAKYDEETNLGLGIEGIFFKDKKTMKFGNVSLDWSSLQIPYKSISTRFGWDALISFFKEVGEGRIQYFLGLSNTKDPNVKILVIYDLNSDHNSDWGKLKEFLSKEIGEKLKGMKIKKKNSKVCKILIDPSCSRKTLEPVLRKYYESI